MNAPRRRVSQPPTNLQMSDIARLAGVSESTVSRALKDSPMIAASTRERIRRLAEEAGYTVNPVASSLRSRQTGVIAVGVPLAHESEPHLVDPFMMTMLAHLADALADRGYNMLLAKIAVHQEGWVRRLQQPGRSDGVILIGQSSEHAAINEAARTGIPMSVWGSQLPGQKYAVVGTDNRLGGRLGTGHLLERGRKRIVFLGDERLPEVAHRHDGYRQALRDAGVKVAPERLVRTGFAAADAEARMAEAIASGLVFDGVVAASDVIAIAAMRALSAAGRRVPEDVAVVGFDDILLAEHAHPPLTTVRQELARGAVALVDTVIAAIRGEAHDSTLLPPTLIVRAST